MFYIIFRSLINLSFGHMLMLSPFYVYRTHTENQNMYYVYLEFLDFESLISRTNLEVQ